MKEKKYFKILTFLITLFLIMIGGTVVIMYWNDMVCGSLFSLS